MRPYSSPNVLSDCSNRRMSIRPKTASAERRRRSDVQNLPDGCMKVCVRTRPLSAREENRGEQVVVRAFCEDRIVKIRKHGRPGGVLRSEMGAQHEYQFDRVFGTACSQQEIYEASTQEIVMDTLRGLNCTVFAYGATGAGKTHTMVGNPNEPGIIPRAMRDIFTGISKIGADHANENQSPHTQMEWNVRLSYLEVYNETIYDLLTNRQRPLQPCEDPTDFRVKVLGLTEVEVTDVDEVLKLLDEGNIRRRMESTAANQVSSRSHAVLQVNVERVVIQEHAPMSGRRCAKPSRSSTKSTLSLIDLAGSERAASTQNRGARLREGANINKSLLALANCINAVSTRGDGKKRPTRVKYRDSKLTHLLKSSLEGNCRLSMIAAINPSNKFYEESHNTLKYANRAKDIKLKTSEFGNKTAITASSTEEIRIEELEAECQELRRRLSANAVRPSQTRFSLESQPSMSPPENDLMHVPESSEESTQDKRAETPDDKSRAEQGHLATRIAALEIQNRALASIAATRTALSPESLISTIRNTAEMVFDEKTQQIEHLRQVVEHQKAELERFQSKKIEESTTESARSCALPRGGLRERKENILSNDPRKSHDDTSPKVAKSRKPSRARRESLIPTLSKSKKRFSIDGSPSLSVHQPQRKKKVEHRTHDSPSRMHLDEPENSSPMKSGSSASRAFEFARKRASRLRMRNKPR
mmetsp:Transcript_17844/g.28912  ORF Transcript_17844/g.28912 Transcript_17844/m.28912 type:complete len:702 (+) Transcript_17844:196-2301(+)